MESFGIRRFFVRMLKNSKRVLLISMAARNTKNKESWKIMGNVFDEFTLRTLFKLESQGHFDALESPIALGKEANTFTAVKGDGRVLVKIYRLENCDFNRMYEYIREDNRFEGLPNNRRKIVFSWTQREYRNLLLAHEQGIRCPTPYVFLNNVLVMELLEDHGEVAPKLKDKVPEDIERAYKIVMDDVYTLYQSDLVHGDLSEYNILLCEDIPYIIDLSHGNSTKAYVSHELLSRDLANVCRYFRKYGVECDEKTVLDEMIHKKKVFLKEKEKKRQEHKENEKIRKKQEEKDDSQ